jgi:DNA-binding NtrC family response regulator
VRRVLVVDDEPAVAETTAALLSGDFDVSTAHDFSSALAALTAAECDVLCTDFHMPGKSGLDLIDEASRRWPEMSTILVTGYREFLNRASPKECGAYYLVVKPYQPQELIDVIERAAEATRVRRNMNRVRAQLRSGGRSHG